MKQPARGEGGQQRAGGGSRGRKWERKVTEGVGRGLTGLGGRGEGADTHSGLEGNELEDHLHGENPGEDHVEDVHGVVEQVRLAVVLGGGKSTA